MSEDNKLWRCSNCKNHKPVIEMKTLKTCFRCAALKQKNYEDNIERELARRKKRYENNREEELVYHSVYRENHRDEANEYAAEYREENREILAEEARVYRKENPEVAAQYRKNRRENDPIFKFRMQMSSLFNKKLKMNGGSKNGKSAFDYLPYTAAELMQYIENLFDPWMNWNNRGNYDPYTWNDNDPSTWKWQLDHIIPHSDSPYDSLEHPNFQKAWALSNLRPLSAKQNQKDGSTRSRHTTPRKSKKVKTPK